jgi:hypothetical protein
MLNRARARTDSMDDDTEMTDPISTVHPVL